MEKGKFYNSILIFRIIIFSIMCLAIVIFCESPSPPPVTWNLTICLGEREEEREEEWANVQKFSIWGNFGILWYLNISLLLIWYWLSLSLKIMLLFFNDSSNYDISHLLTNKFQKKKKKLKNPYLKFLASCQVFP